MIAQLVRRAGWLTLAQYVAAFVALANTVLVSRLLGPEQFGLVALTTSYTTLMWGFVSFKAASVTTRYIAGYHASGRTKELGAVCKLGFAIDLGTALAVTLLVSVSAGAFADGFLGKGFLAPWVVVSALAMPLYALTGTSRTVLMSLDRVDLVGAFIVAEKAVILVCTGLSLATFGSTFEYVIVAQATGQAVIGAAMLFSAVGQLRRRDVKIRSAAIRDVSAIFPDIKRLFTWNYIHTTVSTGLEQLPVLLLGRYESAAAAGIFKIATSLSVIFGYAEASLRKVVYPEFSRRRVSLSGSALLSFSVKLGRRIGPSLFGLTLIMVLVTHWLVPAVFGEEYGDSVIATQILMVAAGVSGLYFWIEAYYFTMGALHLWAKLYLAVGIMSSISMYLIVNNIHGDPVIIFMALAVACSRILFLMIAAIGARRI